SRKRSSISSPRLRVSTLANPQTGEFGVDMAATDKSYRNQYALDVVFAVSSILMLVSIIWMFVQDYNREWKDEQRRFRDVESAMAQRAALNLLPSQDEVARAEEEITSARKKRDAQKEELEKTAAEQA